MIPIITNTESLSVEQIDDLINQLYDVERIFIETNQLQKLVKVTNLCGDLIDLRCKKLGIKI